MESFSTAGLPARRKLSFWNELSSATFAPMEIIPSDREHFEARLSRAFAGPLSFANVATCPGIIRHTQVHLASNTDRGYTLIAPIFAGVSVSLGRESPFAVRVGEFCLLDHSRPYELMHDRPSQTFCVGVDTAFLHALLPQPERAVGVLMQPLRSTSRMLVELLRNLSIELERSAAPVTVGFAHSLAGFIAAAYSEALASEDCSLPQTRKRRIKQYVDEQLHDPQLRPAAIAKRFDISPRYLRLIFESEHESLSAYILRQRLQRCARMLRDSDWRSQTITEIAFRNGFNNATHFGHAFKSRFGTTPREYRLQSATATTTLPSCSLDSR